ncbi:hypothetical protein C7S18_22275 [Ahniella affigens]|uniref:Lipoprotein n=1 Tax=Ahniella affigens TaxID=2021234 RepID=A0A2P1PY07_9GAMM|nr:DUF6491 family protein [Ahniella affigens]AVP99732.1 hypothetical protein C7S18_22275 [Ahniella affigens]
MNMKFPLLLLVAGLTSCAEHTRMVKARDAAALDEFRQFAGEPIKRIHQFQEVDRWRSFDDEHLAIWIGVNKAYLLTLKNPCFDLHRQLGIRITNTNGFIDAKFDRVEFDHQWCRIEEIRPIDEKARKAAGRAAKAS